MAIRYEAYTRLGERVVGTLDTDSEETAYVILERDDLIPYRLRPAGRGGRLPKLLHRVFSPSAQDVIDFTRQLAALLNSGISLRRCLSAQREQAASMGLRHALGEVIDAVESGSKLSDSLAGQSQVFQDFYVRMTRVGESTGGLPEALNQIADTLQRRKTVGDRVRGAVIYPALTLLVAIGGVFILMTYSLPALTGLLSEVGGELPASTRALIAISEAFTTYFYQILVVAAALAASILAATRTETGRVVVDTVLLRLPVVGRVIVSVNMFQFTSILSALLRAGMSPVEALRLTQGGLANAYYRKRLGRVVEMTTQGARLGAAFTEVRGFPPIVSQAIVSGETRGRLPDTMRGLNEYYEDVTKRAASGITELIQPAIILVVAAVAGFVAIAIISSIYSTLEAVG